MSMANERWQNVLEETDRREALVNFVEVLAEEQNFRVAVKGSLLGGLAVGAVACVGSLLLGPVGLLVGGTVGGSLGYCIAKDRYKPLAVVIKEMSPKQKQRLKEHMETIMNSLDIRDVLALVAIMTSDITIKAKIATSVISFLARELGVHVLIDR